MMIWSQNSFLYHKYSMSHQEFDHAINMKTDPVYRDMVLCPNTPEENIKMLERAVKNKIKLPPSIKRTI